MTDITWGPWCWVSAKPRAYTNEIGTLKIKHKTIRMSRLSECFENAFRCLISRYGCTILKLFAPRSVVIIPFHLRLNTIAWVLGATWTIFRCCICWVVHQNAKLLKSRGLQKILWGFSKMYECSQQLSIRYPPLTKPSFPSLPPSTPKKVYKYLTFHRKVCFLRFRCSKNSLFLFLHLFLHFFSAAFVLTFSVACFF